MTEVARVPVVVIGSINVDLSARVPRVPQPGETLLAASNVTRRPGGKGANQAIAASRYGAEVHFIGCVGDDEDGHQSVASLKRAGIDVSHVDIVSVATGAAIVMVLPDGDNFIVISPGANNSMSPERALPSLDEFDCAIILMQGETPPTLVDAVVTHVAERLNYRVVLNLGPYRELARPTLSAADPIILNQLEASQMTDTPIHSVEDGLRVAESIGRLARSCVVTMGHRGACFYDGEKKGHVEAPVVGNVVDTTGAGDAFVGALSAAMSRSDSLVNAVKAGVKAGAASVATEGAQILAG